MNIAKKVRVTAFAIIVALSVLSYIMLGGVSLTKAENNEPPANSEFTAEIDTTKKGTNQVDVYKRQEYSSVMRWDILLPSDFKTFTERAQMYFCLLYTSRCV